eukprot:GHVU01024319.1.p5 GENE.GHVU01024319.1~~GHVU01024319.1.p5  ORF type:complete len:108 (-),score=17.01 GHVU01024319.1:3130-3453(-)
MIGRCVESGLGRPLIVISSSMSSSPLPPLLQRRQATHETAPTPEYIDPTAKMENKTAEKKTAEKKAAEKKEDEGVNKIWIYMGASVGALALIAGIGGITYCCIHQRR